MLSPPFTATRTSAEIMARRSKLPRILNLSAPRSRTVSATRLKNLESCQEILAKSVPAHFARSSSSRALDISSNFSLTGGRSGNSATIDTSPPIALI